MHIDITIVADQEAFLVDAPTPQASPRRWIQAKTETVGPFTVEYAMNHAAAFRNSGAASLLTRHKVRRAGAVG